jgi:diketogulonate reductase-like aldo/keto reductase
LEFNNKLKVPALAFGTGTAWFKTGGGGVDQKLIESIKEAIKAGFTHLDCAEMYGTEKEVGLAIKESGRAREELFVTTKVWKNIHDPAKALEDSLSRLQLDYVDLFLIHAPFFNKDSNGITLKEAWQALEGLSDKGKTKSIGVSNFRAQDLEELLSFARIKPVVNQIEFHPYLLSSSTTVGAIEFARQHGILIESYSSLAPILYHPNGPVDPVVSEIASRLGKTTAQVLLRWNHHTTHGVLITTSSKSQRLQEYLHIFDFDLTEQDIKKIDEAGRSTFYRNFWTSEQKAKSHTSYSLPWFED